MRILAFGDSFVAGAGDPDHQGWIGRVLAGRRGITLYNLGVRRETSADIARRWKGEALPRMTKEEPMRIVFSFGCNDCNLEGGVVRVAPAEALKNAAAMLTEARSLAPVLLVGAPPVPDDGVRERMKALNGLLQALAARLKVPFIDVFETLEANDVFIAEAAAWDGAHPGSAGYQAMADIVKTHPAWKAFLAVD